MTQYFGFGPGIYQPWALNLNQNSLGQSGVARGFQVQQLSTPSMNVQMSLDAVQNDGVCFLSNGAWARIDASFSLGVPSNTSGSLRTDAVVVYVDPTGVSSSNITYYTGWNSGFKGSSNNQFVLAVVNVPNNATSVVNSNIINNPLSASIGSAPQNDPDSLVGSERIDNHGCPPGVFEIIETLITNNATNNQTNFPMPLTGMQRLVPAGRIGGAYETGFFAGRNGWYYPKIRGSVSGLLPINNISPTTGNISTLIGAQAGESIYASYRYYDFARDGKVRGGAMFIEKTSPYLVYQGEVIEDRQFGQQTPLWDGPTGAYILANPTESIIYTDYMTALGLPLIGGPGAATNVAGVYINGAFNLVLGATAAGGPPGMTYQNQYADIYPSPARTPTVVRVTLSQGILAFAGLRVFYETNTTLYISGGIANVLGQPVLLQSLSMQLPAPNSGYHSSWVIYTDRYGNITSSGGTFAQAEERTLGRVPIAAALQYGNPVGSGVASSSYGQWSLPGSYLGWPVTLMVTGNNTAGPTTGFNSGWAFQRDALSTNGAYVVSTTVGDTFFASAVCTGMDAYIHSTATTAGFGVLVDGVSGPAVIYTGGNSQYNVRVTLFSQLSYGTHTVRLQSVSAASYGLDSLDIRVPDTPAAPVNTLPLAQVDVLGFSSVVRTSLIRGSTMGGSTNNSTLLMIDAYRPQAEPAVWLSNSSTAVTQFIDTMQSTGGYILHYQAGPDKGIISLTGYSIDCYAVSPVMETSTVVPVMVAALSISSSGLKNASSTGTGVVINAVDFYPMQVNVTDLRHFGTSHGHASELRASSVQTALGGRLDDGGQGIRAEQIRDRGITSRKMAPVWQKVVVSTQYSNYQSVTNALDPATLGTVTVESPSVLLLNAFATARVSGYVAMAVYLDGQQVALQYAQNAGTGYVDLPVSVSLMQPVPAGTHTVQLAFGNGGSGNFPYMDGNSQRGWNAVAFAL